MKRILAILLTLAMLLSLAACGGGDDPNAGVYTGTKAEMMGMEMSMDEIYAGENSLQLKSGGKGTITLEGDSFGLKWALDGESLTLTIDGVDCTGTLKNGVIKIDFMNMGVLLTFEKEDGSTDGSGSIADKLAGEGTETEAAPAGPLGVYEGTTYEYSGQSFNMTDIYNGLCTIELLEGGKCVFTLGGEVMDSTWTLDGEDFVLTNATVESPGTLKDGVITINFMNMGMMMSFTQTGSVQGGDSTDAEADVTETFPDAFIADYQGDWHGMATVYEGTGAFEDEVDMEMEIIARLVFREDGTCEPYLACAFGGEDNNFKNLSAAYYVDGDQMFLFGEFVNGELVAPSTLFVQDGALYVDVFVEDEKGNTMNLYACLRRLDASWDYDNDWLNLSEDAVKFYKGKSFMEIAELFQLDLDEIPELDGGSSYIPAVTEAPTEAAPGVSASGFGGPNSFQVEEYLSHIVTTVNFTLPESMWVAKAPNDTLYIYNVESLDKAYSNSPRIQFVMKQSLEKINFYLDTFENLQELESRVIGGIEMQGRSYKALGMEWIEYYAELPNGVWVSVQISRTSVEPGSEGSAILDSVTFK